MARAPRGPRAPKSRLASILPSETSRRRLYTAFLNDTMQTCRKTGAVVRVAYTTSGGTRGFAEAGIRPDELVPQRGDDLGAQISGAITEAMRAAAPAAASKRSCLADDVEVTAAGKLPPMLATVAQIRCAVKLQAVLKGRVARRKAAGPAASGAVTRFQVSIGPLEAGRALVNIQRAG